MHHEVEVETQDEGDTEGAVGGENVEEDQDNEEDEEEDDDDTMDNLIASGQIKLKASVKQVIGTL